MKPATKKAATLDAKSFELALSCGAFYSLDDDAVIMGPQDRHRYVKTLLADCVVTCGRCGKVLCYDEFYRCRCKREPAVKLDDLVGKVVYLRCNCDVIPGGRLRLKIKRGKDGRLIACRRGDPVVYDVVAWWDRLEFANSPKGAE